MSLAADDAELRHAFAAARALCRREGGSGMAASFFLPRHKRDGVYAVWAFARLIHQAIAADGGSGDCCSGAGSVVPVLKSRVDAMYAGNVELPLPQFRDETQWTIVAAAETA